MIFLKLLKLGMGLYVSTNLGNYKICTLSLRSQTTKNIHGHSGDGIQYEKW